MKPLLYIAIGCAICFFLPREELSIFAVLLFIVLVVAVTRQERVVEILEDS